MKIKIFIGYHMTHKYGVYPGNYLYTSKDVPEGCLIAIISGEKKSIKSQVDYYLEGIFYVDEVIAGSYELSDPITGEKQVFDFKLILKANISKKFKRILLNDLIGFDKKLFHNNFTSGSGVKEITSKTIDIKIVFDALYEEQGFDILEVYDKKFYS